MVPARCRFFTPDEIPVILPEVEHLIQRALDRGSAWLMSEIRQGLENGTLQLWTYGTQAILITALQGDDCLLLCLAGEDMETWKHHLDDISAWAKSNGCKTFLVHGRKGWTRMFDFNVEGQDELGLYIMRRKI